MPDLQNLTDDEIAALDEADIREIHHRNLKMEAAAQAVGFAGELRRAIDASRRNPSSIAADCGVDVFALESFRMGEQDLPSSAIERLVDVLGLHLAPAGAGEDRG